MKKWIEKYRSLSEENRLILVTVVTMIASALLAGSKIIMGVLSDYLLCVVGLFSLLLCIAKLECILGIKNQRLSFKARNTFVAFFVLLAGILYVFYMAKDLLFEREAENYTMTKSIGLAALGFFEMGLAIAGLIQSKKKNHFYRDIKIINFINALVAIMTAQIALLAFSENEATLYNCYTGMGIGILTILLGIYIFYAPKTSLIGREHQAFIPVNKKEENPFDITVSICNSYVYGNYSYIAKGNGEGIEGEIVKGKGLFKRMPLVLKIIVLILSEILLPVWAFGYFVYFIRTMDLPTQLEKKMIKIGYIQKTADTSAAKD